MTKEELIDFCEMKSQLEPENEDIFNHIAKILEQEPCEITAEEYRQRMIQAFYNADCDELIAICVLPTEKEFEHLEWLLKNHYKKDTCEDCVSRQAVIDYLHTNMAWYDENGSIADDSQKLRDITNLVNGIPSDTPTRKKGKWITKPHFYGVTFCSECGFELKINNTNYCPNCGSYMEVE